MSEKQLVKYIFIIPYRDRIEHKTFFERYMKFIMEDYDDSVYDIIYCHQSDNRKFNRGAMKNIGFLYCKEKYPENYRDIIFIFNDVDSIPYKKNLLDYDTPKGTVKHFYGYNFALGGIVAMTGEDFEATNGFPNYWYWGFEDNVMNNRVLKQKLKIDRSQFYDIFSKKILHFSDDFKKLISLTAMKNNQKNQTENDGLDKLRNVAYFRENEMLNITSFEGLYSAYDENFIEHNLFEGRNVNLPSRQKNNTMNLFGRSKSIL